MKLVLTAALLGLIGVANAQNLVPIRSEVARIDKSLPKFQKVSHNVLGESTEGGDVIVYFGAQKSPRKIVAHFYGESGRNTHTVYLRGGTPIFGFFVEEDYRMPLSPDVEVKVARRTETRSYFSSGKLILQRIGTKNSVLSPAQKRAVEKKMLADIAQYLKWAR